MIKPGGIAVITDGSHPAAEAVARRLEGCGVTVIRNYPCALGDKSEEASGKYHEFDTCSLSDMNKLLLLIEEKLGKVNFLIHTDNVIFRASLERISEEDFKKTMDRNVKSAFISTKVFGEHIIKQGEGSIVYLSSLHDEKPTGCAFAYSIAKGAVKMLSKELALFYGRKGVRVNLIEMDYMEGSESILDSTISPFNYEADTKIPMRRALRPEDVAALAVFLLSEDAAHINGADIRVDGGHLLHYIDR
jgi:glucose 1-dehydrogenase